MSCDEPIKYKDLPLDSYFKTDPTHVQYFLKWKLGRKHVAQSMVGGFTFLSPSGRSPNLLVYPFNPHKNHNIHD